MIGKVTSALFLLMCGMMLTGMAEAAGNALKDISVASMAGNQVVISFEMTSEPTEPSSFTIGNPSRIALDFADTAVETASKDKEISLGYAQSLSLAEAGGRTRAVVTLTEMVPYHTKLEGNKVLLIIGSGGEEQAAAAAVRKAVAPASTTPTLAATDKSSITDIDFRRGSDGQGLIVITLSDSQAPVDVREEGGQVLIDLVETDVPGALIKRLDVSDFGTPVNTIDVGMRGNDARLVVNPTGYYDQMAYQSGNEITVEFRPLTRQEREDLERERFAFTGERLSLNFQNIEVRAVLQLIADFTGLNVVVSDTVGGTITLRLQNVPWDQALDIILKTRGLSMRQNGNVIMIAPTQEIANREKLELESQKQVEELAPLRSEFVQVNYAKAATISGLLGTAGSENSLLSSRGSVTVDERTNTLLVRDTVENLAEVRRLVARLDIPVRQVMIDSRIVIASNDFSRDLGVRFGVGRDNSSATDVRTGGGTIPTASQDYGINLGGSVDGSYAVDLGVAQAAAAFGLSWGKIGSYLLQLELQAMETEGQGEVVSNPRVITSNQRKAMIEQGIEVAYKESSLGDAAVQQTSFKKASLKLEVTPQITPDDAIIMDLLVQKDSVGQVINGEPSIDTRQVETQVLVANGETVVLGGVYEHATARGKSKVPFLSDLPLLGWMFQNSVNTDNRQELLIFVTPRIIKEDLRLSR